MKLNKIVDKVKNYLQKDELKKSHHSKIIKIIDDLKQKRAKIKKELKQDSNNEDKQVLQNKLVAISKLLKKSKKLLKK